MVGNMPEIKQNDAGEYCLEGYGDADACYPTENEAKAAVEKLSADKAAADEPAEEAPAEDVTDPEAEEETPAGEASVNVPSSVRKLTLNLGVDAEEKTFERIWRRIKERLNPTPEFEATGIKVVGNRWLVAYSNNFEDRDGEIFTAKAIDDYVARVDMGIVPPPELWVWHLPGTRIGQADWVDRHDHFVIAMGTFDDTPQGQKARDYYAQQTGKKNLSHGFKFAIGAGYSGGDFDGKHFHKFNTFEISLLPRGTEANMFTSLEGVKAMAKEVTEAKKAEILAVFGEDDGKRILENLTAKGKALEELGVAYKDFVEVDPVTPAATKAVENADKSFRELVPDLMEGSAEAVVAALEAVKEVKTLRQQVKELTENYTEVRKQVDLRPRIASKSDETALSETSEFGKAVKEKLEQQMVERDPFTGLEVTKAP